MAPGHEVDCIGTSHVESGDHPSLIEETRVVIPDSDNVDPPAAVVDPAGGTRVEKEAT